MQESNLTQTQVFSMQDHRASLETKLKSQTSLTRQVCLYLERLKIQNETLQHSSMTEPKSDSIIENAHAASSN